MRTALQTRRPHGTEERQAPTTAEADRSPIHRARDQVRSRGPLVRHEAVDSASRRRSHQERSVSSRPRVVAFEEARWSGQQPTEFLDATRLPSRRGGAGGGQQTSRFGQTIVSDDSGLSAPPIHAAMGSARPDLDAPGSRQPAVALGDGQHHMVHLYFPLVPVMVCTTTGLLFLEHLPRHVPGKSTRSRMAGYPSQSIVREFLPVSRGQLNAGVWAGPCS
jgi:hypothetical protein